MTVAPLLEMKAISKSFPGVKALKNVHLRAHRGRVMALLGENGAGKSTLMKILSGVYSADEGNIIFDGEPVNFKSTHQSAAAGIAIIHQELNLIPNLTVAENLFLGKEPVTFFGKLDKRKIYDESKKLLQKVNLDISPDTPISALSVGMQQMVEIARSFTIDAKLIIMDEPTASLSGKDVLRLFELISQLKAQGKAVIYISHRMNEIFTVCDDVTILRDGEWIAERQVADTCEDELIEDIVGRKIEQQYPFVESNRGDAVFAYENIHAKGVNGNSGCFYSGETVGIAGLVGSGRTELAKALFGASSLENGKFFIDHKSVKITSPGEALKRGIVYLSEDRKGDGLVLGMSVTVNTTLSILKQLEAKFGYLKADEEKNIVDGYIEKLKIKTPSAEQSVENLSGGNQQKVVLARALTTNPKILILDEPTRGIDVGAKKEIYDLINRLKSEGIAVVMISSDMNEILGMSDRVLVLSDGHITGEMLRKDATAEKIMKYAVGIENDYQYIQTRS